MVLNSMMYNKYEDLPRQILSQLPSRSTCQVLHNHQGESSLQTAIFHIPTFLFWPPCRWPWLAAYFFSHNLKLWSASWPRGTPLLSRDFFNNSDGNTSAISTAKVFKKGCSNISFRPKSRPLFTWRPNSEFDINNRIKALRLITVCTKRHTIYTLIKNTKMKTNSTPRREI